MDPNLRRKVLSMFSVTFQAHRGYSSHSSSTRMLHHYQACVYHRIVIKACVTFQATTSTNYY